jgi:hypothetical protein
MNKEKQINKNDIISASEIGQYSFCSTSWYLQRSGFKPISSRIEEGKKFHHRLGNSIEVIKKNNKISKRLIFYGVLFVIFSIIMIILEVILFY